MSATKTVCECGCGNPPRAQSRFIKGHNGRRPMEVRFWEKVDKADDCWLWVGGKSSAGYGTFNLGDQKYDYAHRVAYRLMVGSIPEGLVLDHLCRVRHCCNPNHLEPVVQLENVRRGQGVFEFAGRCMSGKHQIDRPSDYRLIDGGRRCLACDRDDRRRRYQLVKAAAHQMNMRVTHYIAAFGCSERLATSVLDGQVPA